MFKVLIEEDLKAALNNIGYKLVDIVLSIPENSKFGDYSTNVALGLPKQTSKKSYQSSLEIASDILESLGHPNYLERVEIAGPGFINFFLKDESLVKILDEQLSGNKSSKKYLIEFGHTNPLKEIHIGHLRTFILGESISRILSQTGHEVFRANYQGDIGLHIAKAIWGIKKLGLPTQDLGLAEKANFMGQAYAEGNSNYEGDPNIKKEIDEINIKLYQKDPDLMELYSLAREWSLDYFQPIYELLNIKYDRCFFESEVFERGKEIVRENIGKVFKEDNGAVIFPGEDFGLHTRVFITQAGNPTYEGKEMGLAELEYQTFPYDDSVHIVANEQEGYFKVVIKAIELVFPHLKGKKHHYSYGFVDLKEGKMSSRTGNVVSFDDLFKVVSEKVREVMKDNDQIDQSIVKKVAIGAIKFAYLKFGAQSNMTFDLDQSVSLQGDSGPYVQYTHARTQSVLENAKKLAKKEPLKEKTLTEEEREVLKQLEYAQMVLDQAAKNLDPNQICYYLLNLAKAYNLFYQKCPILKSDKEALRLAITEKTGDYIKLGLNLLGIEAPNHM